MRCLKFFKNHKNAWGIVWMSILVLFVFTCALPHWIEMKPHHWNKTNRTKCQSSKSCYALVSPNGRRPLFIYDFFGDGGHASHVSATIPRDSGFDNGWHSSGCTGFLLNGVVATKRNHALELKGSSG